jgi:hypothetical protein
VGLIGLLALLVGAIAAVPAAVAIVLVHPATGRTIVGLVSLAYGYGLWRLGSGVAVRAANRRGPELLATLSQGTGAT